MILSSDSTSCGLPRCSDPLRCSSASRLRWASSGLSERAEMYRNCSSKLLSSSIFQNVVHIAACFVVCHVSRWDACNAWNAWRPLPCRIQGAVKIEQQYWEQLWHGPWQSWHGPFHGPFRVLSGYYRMFVCLCYAECYDNVLKWNPIWTNAVSSTNCTNMSNDICIYIYILMNNIE